MTAPAPQSAPQAPGGRHDLPWFVLIAFGFSWAFWVPMALAANWVPLPGWLTAFLAGPWNIGAFGPTFAALVLVGRAQGWAGIGRFVRDGVLRRFGLVWLLPILLLMPLIALAALAVALGPQGTRPWLGQLGAPLPVLAVFVTMLLLSGPLQEEFGWRGYALPRLLERYSALWASVVIGFVWALWHFPLNFANAGTGPQYVAALSMLLGSIVTMIGLSVLFTWIFVNTGGSVLAAMLFHASLNSASFALFPVFEVPEALPVYTGLILLAAGLAIAVFGPRRLTRGP